MFFTTDFIHEINCKLISEEISVIEIHLKERRASSLNGNILKNDKIIGSFSTSKPKTLKPGIWNFKGKDSSLKGEIIFFKNEEIWHAFQSKIESKDVNRVIFSGLSSQLQLITEDRELLKASSGFFKIGRTCYGGRINKV